MTNGSKPSILVLCTGNSARSQMAEGILRGLFGDRFEVYSAGTHPSIVLPWAIQALAEIGIDISHHRSKSVDEFAGREIDYVLTVCDNARENCPYFPAKTQLIHHAFDDPAFVPGDEETRLAAFRRVRDKILSYAETEFAQIIKDR
ncbi:MAG: arsenate reductase ArsC [Pyrinomonadaceae bacterium]|nr:arsenate reductase ArsC [Pyrinomonadaceae bacterium]